MLKYDIPVHGRRLRIRHILLRLRIQNLGEPVDRNARLAHLRNYAPEPPDGRNEHRVIKRERDKLPLRHIAADAQDTAEHDDQHHLQTARHVAHRPELRERVAELHPEIRVDLILLLKALALERFSSERAHDTHARQVFLRNRRQNALRLVAVTKAAADQVEALKDADVVISLAHLGVDGESKPYRSTDLYAAVKGIDFIIDGHSHTVMTKGENGEPIQSTGTAFANIGVIVIDDATKKIESNSLFEIKEDTAKDATVAAAAQKIIDRIDKEYGAVFAKSEVELNGAKAPNGNRDSETNNGDLITDAMVWKILQDKESLTVDADHVVAVTNGGGIRKAINPGDVTKKNINEVLPFGNTVVTIYITGAELLEALEASTYCTPDAIGGFPQVSGINYTISTAVAYDANAETYPASTYYGPKSINRVTINSINGKEFKADDTYAVITNDFCGGGGDTYYAFAAATAKFDTGIPLDEVVMEYITAELKGVIGKQYAEPQGRILMNPFKDVKTSAWYGSYVIDLYNDGIINGTSATTYAPNDTLTWAAALKLLLVSNGDLKAADATGADWSKNTIAKAAELGLVAADLDGAKAISRLEFCQVAAKRNKLAESKTESKFTDCTDGYVMALVDAKVINGMTETTFEPDASLTRAQIAKIIYQLNLIEK